MAHCPGAATANLATTQESTMAVLIDTTKPTYDQLVAMMAKQAEELAAIKAAHKGVVTFKVQPSGCVTVKGLTNPKYAPTLYPKVWKGILENAEALNKFIDDHIATGELSLEKRT
jgi:hypothetical protein